jgi:competence protein ComEC
MQHAPLASINKIWITNVEYLLLYAAIISLFSFIYYKRGWLMQTMLACILLLSISVSYKKISAGNTNNIAFLNLHKNIGIVMESGSKAIVISNLADTDKKYRYSIQPYLDSSKAEYISLYSVKQDIHSDIVFKHNGYVQFLNRNFMLINGKDAVPCPDKKLRANYIYLTGNPYKVLNSLDSNYISPTIVIDAGNSNTFIDSAKNVLNHWHQNYVVLKRNISLMSVSNHQ